MVKNIHTAFLIQEQDAGKKCPDIKGRDSDLEYIAEGSSIIEPRLLGYVHWRFQALHKSSQV